MSVKHRDIKETWWCQITLGTNFSAITIYIQVNWQKWLSVLVSLSELSHIGMNEIFLSKKEKRGSRIYQSAIRSGVSHFIYFPSVMSIACTGSVPVMTPTLTGITLGDTSLLHVLGLVLFAQDRFTCIFQPTALQLICSTHLSPLTGLAPQMQ